MSIVDFRSQLLKFEFIHVVWREKVFNVTNWVIWITCHNECYLLMISFKEILIILLFPLRPLPPEPGLFSPGLMLE